MTLRLRALVERIRASLFFVPMLAVVAALVIASVAIGFDSRLGRSGSDLPLGFSSTVDSARALLGTVAGATITFAAIAFSVSLLIIQQASSQYSPRVVHTLFRDPFNKRVMGLVVGTFTYCLLILRSVRSALEAGGEPVVPNLSVAIGVALGISTILAIVAFIDHSAHSMDISTILQDVEDQAIAQIRGEWPEDDATARPPGPRRDRPAGGGVVIRFDRSGWVQQIDVDKLLACVPAGCTLWVDAFPGRYAIEGTPVGVLSGACEDAASINQEVRAAIGTGDTRTMQQDVSFGLRQLTDVALRALSPGVNDPTTAQDAIFHSAAVLAELLRRQPPSGERGDGRGRVVLVHQPDHDDLIRLAFDEVRRAAACQPAVCIYLLEALALLAETIDDRDPERTRTLRRQAELVVAGAAEATALPADLHDIERAFATRFAAPGRRVCSPGPR